MTLRPRPQPFVDAWDIDPEELRALLYDSPSSERIRWWQATPDPTYNRTLTQADEPGGFAQWRHTEQVNTRIYRALVQGAQAVKRYLPQGQMQQGDITVTTMPDELPLADHDWVVPIGRVDYGLPSLPDARAFVFKEWLQRGGALLKGQPGTVSASGATITGVGTTFTSTFRVGDIIEARDQMARVVTIGSDTSLLIDSAPSPAWRGNNYALRRERLLWDTAVAIDLVEDTTQSYALPGAVGIGPDGQTLQWSNALNSPLPGATVAVVYRYAPKYVVLPGVGTRRHVVHGVGLPQTVVARLINPETFRSP